MLTIMSPKGVVVGALVNDVPEGTPYSNDEMKETLENFGLSLEFHVPADSPTSALIEVEGFIVYKTLDDSLKIFKVKEVFLENQGGERILSVYAENSAVSEIITQPIRPQEHMGKTLIQYAQIILVNTGWELGECEFLGIRDVKFDDYTNALEALYSVASAFEAEVDFEIEMRGSLIERRVIHFRKRGNFTGKVFEYSKDLTSIKRTEDSKNLVTALIGVGKADDAGSVLTFANTAVIVPSGYVRNGDFVYSVEAFQKYSRNDRQIFGVYKDENATNGVELFENTLKRLKELEKPLVNYSIDVILLEKLTGYEHEKVRLGDTIFVKDFSFSAPIIVEARVIEIVRSQTDPTQDKVVLGNFIQRDYARTDEMKRLQQIIFLKEQQWNASADKAETAIQLAGSQSQDIADLQGTVGGLTDSVADAITSVGVVEGKVSELEGAVGDHAGSLAQLEEVTSGTHILEMVVNSQSYLNDLASKADVDDLGVYITHERVEQISDELRSEMAEVVSNIDLSEYATKSEVTATANQLDFKFSSSGGVNLIKNSTGFAGTDFWSANGGITTVQTAELAEYGIGSGFAITAGGLDQTIQVSIDKTYTISTIARKGADGYAHLKVFYDNDSITKGFSWGTAYDYVLTSVTFTPKESNLVTVQLYGDATYCIFTGTMMNVGEVPLQWQHASGEVYNTNVLMDMNGVKVVSNQYKGYTAITPEEFSGYAENEHGIMERVFTLNNDVTEVKKLKVEEQISMAPIRLVAFSGSRNGWAWLPE